MITDQDITKLKEVFVTKDEFNQVKNKVDSMDVKINTMDAKINTIDAKLDKLLSQTEANAGALRSIQEEQAIKTYRADQLEDHEERIEKLEKHTGLASS